MFLDQNLQFSNAQAITSTALATNAYDLALGVAVAAAAGTNVATSALPIVWGKATVFGADFGIGNTPGVPRCVGTAIAAFTAAGAATLQVQFQGAIDDQATTMSTKTWVTFAQTDTIGKALLTASTRIFSFDWPMRKIVAAGTQQLPRFVTLNYVVATGPFTAGTMTTDNAMGGADDATGSLGQYPANFTVAA
jgi:hypothetical protein